MNRDAHAEPRWMVLAMKLALTSVSREISEE
jgi:hypothetical protein